jgi:hypothetical protein
MKLIKPVILILALTTLAGCSLLQQEERYQPLPPVKVITETVEVEIYQPPLPPAITLSSIDWKVITNTPCKPATGTKKLPGGKSYNTTERFAYEDYTKEDGTSARRVQRDEAGQRIELEALTDQHGEVIQVCGNLEQKIAEIETTLDGNFVVLAITPVGYEKMAANLQDIKRYINQQKEIIYYYREATKPKGREGWLEENAERQNNDLEEEQSNNEQQYQPEPKKESGFSLQKLIPGLGSSDE